MPIVSGGGGGGGGGPAAGTYLPVADAGGVTVNTTSYNNTVDGSGKLTTLVFPNDTAALAFAIAGDAFPRFLIGTDLNDAGLAFSDGTFDPNGGGASMYLTGAGTLGLNGYSGSLSQILANNTSAGSHQITSLTDPTNPQDAATRAYVLANAYVAPVTVESFVGVAVSIANGAGGALTWDGAAGTALLNVSTLDAPTMVAAGTYGVTVNVVPTADLTVGGSYDADLSASGLHATASSPPSVTGNPRPMVSVSIPSHVAAAGILSLVVTNHDGAATRGFKILSATVQRIT